MKQPRPCQLLYLILTLLLLPVSVECQNLPENGERAYIFGVKGGLNFSSLSTYNVIEENTKTGINFGLFFKKAVYRNFSIQPEAVYSRKGSELSFDNRNFQGTARFGLNYLDIPILLVYNPSPFFNVQLGPSMGILLNTRIKNRNPAGTVNGRLSDFESEVGRNNFKALDSGLVAGMGIELGKAHAGIRYSFGLMEIGREEMLFGVSYSFPGSKNRMAQLYIGYAF